MHNAKDVTNKQLESFSVHKPEEWIACNCLHFQFSGGGGNYPLIRAIQAGTPPRGMV